ncbi:MAG: site-2 protease family protein [Nakamurella sp.]
MSGPLSKQTAGRWVFPALVAIAVAAGYAAATGTGPTGLWIFVVVLAGWVISLCLHEFAHASTALAGGDLSVRARGYLTLNPFRYVNATYSIVIPVVVLAIGGVPLPGGAVLIENHRLRTRWWSSLVSLAGPATNLLLGVLLVLLTRAMPHEYTNAFASPNGLMPSSVVPGSAPVRHRDLEHLARPGVRRLRHPGAPSFAGHPARYRSHPALGTAGGVRDPLLHPASQYLPLRPRLQIHDPAR